MDVVLSSNNKAMPGRVCVRHRTAPPCLLGANHLQEVSADETPVCPVPMPPGSNGGIAIIHPWTWMGRGKKFSGHDSCPVTAKCFHHLHAAAACGFKANCERFVQIRARKFRGSRAYGGCEPAISYEYPVPSRHGGTAGHWTLILLVVARVTIQRRNSSLSVNAQLLITTGQHLPARLVFRGK